MYHKFNYLRSILFERVPLTFEFQRLKCLTYVTVMCVTLHEEAGSHANMRKPLSIRPWEFLSVQHYSYLRIGFHKSSRNIATLCFVADFTKGSKKRSSNNFSNYFNSVLSFQIYVPYHFFAILFDILFCT